LTDKYKRELKNVKVKVGIITCVIIYEPQSRGLRHSRETNIKLEDGEDVDLIWVLG